MGRHYLTRDGAAKLGEELRRLVEVDRPRTVDEVATAAAHGDRSENAEYKYGKLRLRDLDRRIRWLDQRLRTVVVVDPGRQQGDVVHFGAAVEVEDEDGERRCYQLVGEDESEPARGRISYTSPIGRALLKRKVGDRVTVRRPAGQIELEIMAVRYS